MSTLNRAQKVVLEGKGTLTIRPQDYVTSGGEGSIYRVQQTIIKLYDDQDKMRRDGMVEKIGLLKRIIHPSIVQPEGVVYKPSGEPIGFFMQFAEGEPMSRVFTNDFRARENFTDDMAQKLVERMRDTVLFAHEQGAILVDANELNWLVGIKGVNSPTPRVIDVDSWAIGRFGASVVMPSIRDWHSKEFNAASDWFSWGVVSFQVFTGIHPYKGRLDGFGAGDLEARMRANKSVFTSGVHLNRAVRDLSLIPRPLCAWYEGVFQHAERGEPPSVFAIGTASPNRPVIMRVVTNGTGSLIFEKIFGDSANPVIRVWPCGVALCADLSLFDLRTKRVIKKLTMRDCEVLKVEGGWLVVACERGSLFVEYVAEATLLHERLDLPLATQKIFRSDNRLFAITERGLTELSLRLFGHPVLAVGSSWGAPVGSTKFYDGVGIEDALGAKFLVLPFGDGACAVVRVPELDTQRVVNAKAGSRFVAVTVVTRKGTYERFEFVFDRAYAQYVFQKTAVDTPELNMSVLPKGVVASIEDDGKLIVHVPSSGKVVKISDKHVHTDMQLTRWDDTVLYIKDGAVWSLRMK